MKYFGAFFLFIGALFGAELAPFYTIEASGIVYQIEIKGDELLAGTSAGSIDVYHLKNASLQNRILFPKIKDFTGDEVAPKIFSVDKFENHYLAVVQASSGARELYVVEEGKPRVLIDSKANMMIAKAKFVDKNRILVALLSNELILWDSAKNKALYQTQLNPSHFSDFALNESRSMVASSGESGEITINDVNSGKMIKVLKGANVDNVYKVDFKQEKILCAGQDRRGVIYTLSDASHIRFDAPFLIYAGAISPSLTYAAFAFNQENDIVLFNLATKSKTHTLKGQKSTLNTILFASEKELVSSSDDKFIMIWRLP
ncbi:WD40 repeat domain-containing protein [Sulfurospirillum barnesii]|uniref:WD40 repeat-containing protein n=1 Tax=Sulfurospirillum barnesii (strain ATCC 700032 / DSM 10660 / SES-3) TaxID=760154 RepID=I3XVX9_SULBS|nr:hypothetical protein [Sulfurospirillum barnesii]AFL68103.1 WD40 repeat-containing protein [Sulfurospirillum barnesii SES-3]